MPGPLTPRQRSGRTLANFRRRARKPQSTRAPANPIDERLGPGPFQQDRERLAHGILEVGPAINVIVTGVLDSPIEDEVRDGIPKSPRPLARNDLVAFGSDHCYRHVALVERARCVDLVREEVYRGSADRPLEIPPDAVVVPGARKVNSACAEREGLSLQTPVIVKYRDDKTDSATALEGWLR